MNGNGAQKIVWWLLGVAGAGVVTLGGLWTKTTQDNLSRVMEQQQQRGERISTLEESGRNIERRLTSIEDKTDKILEKIIQLKR